MLQSLIRLLQRELLNQALHPMRPRKRNRLLAIQRMSRRPAADAQGIQNHGDGVHGDWTDGRVQEEFAHGRQAVEERADDFGVGRRYDDTGGAAEFLKFFRDILRLGVDVVGCSKLHGEVLFVGATGKGDGAVTHLARVLDCQVT